MKYNKHNKHADDADFKDLRRFLHDANGTTNAMINNHSSDNSDESHIGESHIDDIVGAGFARPHLRHITELHNGDMGVGAKNFSPQRRTDCDDNKSRRDDTLLTVCFSLRTTGTTINKSRRDDTFTDVSSLRDSMKVGYVFSTDISSLRDLLDNDCEHRTRRDARPCVSTVPKGHNFHNRRSSTCGREDTFTDVSSLLDLRRTSFLNSQFEINSNYNEYTC